MTETEKMLNLKTEEVMKWAHMDALDMVRLIVENVFLLGKIAGVKKWVNNYKNYKQKER